MRSARAPRCGSDLPRATEEATVGGRSKPAPTTLRAQHALRILLVEDNEEVAAGTEALLQMMGHHVTCVLNADMALGLLDDAHTRQMRTGEPLPFDVVLSDIHMPGSLNGIDLAEAIRRSTRGCRSFLVTGYAEELDRARHVNVRVLSKPFDIALLESFAEDNPA